MEALNHSDRRRNALRSSRRKEGGDREKQITELMVGRRGLAQRLGKIIIQRAESDLRAGPDQELSSSALLPSQM